MNTTLCRLGVYTSIPVLLVAMSGCSEASGSDGANADAAPLLTLEEVQRIGSVDDPDLGFAAISSVEVDRDGNLYVFEMQQSHLRVYSPDGRLVRTIGRRGEGPGEFRSSPRFGIVGDTIWTFQTFPRLLTLFDRAGNVLLTSRFEGVTVPLAGNMNGIAMPYIMRPDGNLVSDMTLFVPNREGSSLGANDTVAVPRVLFDVHGSIIDTIGFTPRPPPEPYEPEFIEIESQRFALPRPPRDEPIDITLQDSRIVIARDAPATADAATFSVTRLGFPGDTLRHRAYTYTPKPFSDAVLDTFALRTLGAPNGIVAMIGGVMARPQPPDDPDAARGVIRSRMSFPAFQPPVQQHFVAADGSLWLRREDAGAATHEWLLLDPEGDLRGVVHLRRTTRPAWASGNSAWLIELDEFDVPWLVGYRIPGS